MNSVNQPQSYVVKPYIIRLLQLVGVGLLCSTISPVSAEDAVQPSLHAIFRSTDRGRSWVRSDKGIPGNTRINAFGSLGDSVFAGTDSGIFLSKDEGQSWKPAKGAAATAGRITGFASAGQRVYAGTERNGILVSRNQGVIWARDFRFPAQKVRCLLSHEGRLYAGTDADGVFVSDQNGQHWTRLSRGLPPHAQIFAMSVVKGKLFAGLYAKGLFAWSEQEQRWSRAGRVSPLALASLGGTLIAGHNPGGLFWSDDSGANWSDVTRASEMPGGAPVWELGSGDGLAVAGVSAGIYYSEDRGRTWVRGRKGLPAKSAGVSFLLKRNLILAGTVMQGATIPSAGP